MGGRSRKRAVLEAIGLQKEEAMERALLALVPQQAVGPLIGAFCHRDSLTRWRAVTGIGLVCRKLHRENPEAVRVVMRRLIWMLNDESGGIGWGASEAMAEIMVQIPEMADTYHRILVSYTDPDGNYLEHPVLQRGLLWAIARMAAVCPAHVQGAAANLTPYLAAKDPELLAGAIRAAGDLGEAGLVSHLVSHLEHPATVTIYRENTLVSVGIADLARDAVRKLSLQNLHP